MSWESSVAHAAEAGTRAAARAGKSAAHAAEHASVIAARNAHKAELLAQEAKHLKQLKALKKARAAERAASAAAPITIHAAPKPSLASRIGSGLAQGAPLAAPAVGLVGAGFSYYKVNQMTNAGVEMATKAADAAQEGVKAAAEASAQAARDAADRLSEAQKEAAKTLSKALGGVGGGVDEVRELAGNMNSMQTAVTVLVVGGVVVAVVWGASKLF